MIERLKLWAKRVLRDTVALYLAARDPRTPLMAKLVAVAVVAYAASPVDLIPDFIPVLGYLDDLLILPLGILLAVRLIPAGLMAEFRAAADERARLPAGRAAAAVIVALWVSAVLLMAWLAVGPG